MFDVQIFAKNLRHFRKLRGLSNAALADCLGLSSQHISEWEQGTTPPEMVHIQSLANALEVSLNELIGVTTMPALIAIDGGGTKTEVALISIDGHLLKRVVLAGSNPNTYSVQGCAEILQKGIDAMLQLGYHVLGIHIGCAGMFSGNNSSEVEAILKNQYPQYCLKCQSDICNVLACAKDPDNAIAVIGGTGSVVYASVNGELIRTGGGGWRLDTLGSGYDMGRQAILAAMENRDGTGLDTILTEGVENRLGGPVWSNIHAIHSESPAFIASFAPLLLDAWQKNDSVATTHVMENCKRIAYLIKVAASKSPRATEVLFSGGLFTNCSSFYDAVTVLLEEYLTPSLVDLPQIWGSFLCCARMCGIEAPNSDVFMEQYTKES